MNLFESRSRGPNRDLALGYLLPKPFHIMTHIENDSICMKQWVNGGIWNPEEGGGDRKPES